MSRARPMPLGSFPVVACSWPICDVIVRYPVAILLFYAWFGLNGAAASAEVRRLPAVMPPSEAVPVQAIDPTAVPDEIVRADAWDPPAPAAEPLMLPLDQPAAPDPDRPPGARDGVFQRITFQSTWLAGGSRTDSFGMSDLELKTTLALPIPSRQYPLIITPGFAAHWLDGPQLSDLPPRVYDAHVQFRWMRRISPRLGVDLAVTPGVFSDFEHGYDDALRITGYGAGMYTCSPTTKIVLGAAYLDRDDVSVLPVGGIIWKPSDNLVFELVAPRPQISRRIDWQGVRDENVQDWIYLAGEYGGGTWAIERADARFDTFTYSDYRVMLGLERKVIGGLGGWVEVGYVFGRNIEYGSRSREVSPPGTVLLRAGMAY